MLQDVPTVAVFKDGSYDIYDGENFFRLLRTFLVSDVSNFLSVPLGWCRPSSAVEEAGSEKPAHPSRGSPGRG